ncbi:hypothetical protein MLD38_024124 [Melastoma candidum]|uniref:Uncharacterized protein n=1 Tax=Melastoma candidum TaxID=119954 RepID=A0ACB9NTZ3_9MYRT|nr:hypothetical protein MLD38_024124 [Melastoma candidum]
MASAEHYLNSPSTPSDDLLRVASAISASAARARSHVNNCSNLSEHASLVAKMLGLMKGTFLMELDVIKEEVIDELEEALMRGAELAECCVVKSVFYMVATGWNVVYRFREVHEEMDRFLKPKAMDLFVEEFRMQDLKEAIKATRNDVRRYELDDEDMEFQQAILKPDRTRKDADIIERSLSRYYPDMEIAEALGEERQKLQVELERFTAENDPKMCRLVEHLIEVTGNVMNDFPTRKAHKLIANAPAYVISGYITNAGAIADALKVEDQCLNYWQTDLFDCCKEPCLSLKTCIYPCGLFSHIAYKATGGRTAREAAINHLLGYSLFCGCCCYSCWIRKKLRELFNIEGSVCDDFLTHLMCCCCALVQEWRELELRELEGCRGRKMIPPPFQYMKP